MAYTVADVKNELTGVLHGTTLNKVVGLDVLMNRAGRKLISDCDPIETIRILPLASPLFDLVYDYPLPVDTKGDRVIDIRPQVNRTNADRFTQNYNEPFDVYKSQSASSHPEFTIQYNTGVKSIRIAKNTLTSILINSASGVTNVNGTWSTSGNASNITTDNLNYVYDSGSIRWDVTAGSDPSTASVENSTMTAVNLTRDEDQGSIFCYVYIPTFSAVDSFTMNWGSSSTDYWSRTVTVTQFNTTFQNGWNLLQFQWHGATVTGSPDASAVNYVKFTTTYNGEVDESYRLNWVVSQLGTIYDIVYYSKYLYRDGTTGAFQENITDDSNIVNLDTDSYNLYFNQVAYLTAQQVQGADSSFDAQFFRDAYETDLKRYVAKIKSQVLKPTQTYYKMTTPKDGPTVRYSSS